MGPHVILYIDDGICASATEPKCCEDRQIIVSDLEQAGFVLNTDKSCLKPHQVADWLGFIVDLGAGYFRVPEDKISRLKHAIQSVASGGILVGARSLASVIGQIISMSLAVGSVSRLRTRAMYSVLNQRRFWSDKLTLTVDAQEELEF